MSNSMAAEMEFLVELTSKYQPIIKNKKSEAFTAK